MLSAVREMSKMFWLGLGLLIVVWVWIRQIDPIDQLRQFHHDYPLIQSYQQAQHNQDPGWLKLKDSSPLSQGRLKKLVEFMVDQFGLKGKSVRIDEALSGIIKRWRVQLIIGANTDREIWELKTYIDQELSPLVRIKKFSIHRSGSLDESVLQQGQIPDLVEGRLDLDWISK